MIIEHVTLRQWRHIQHLDLSLGTGINVLYGPNEIGKSTLIEAIQEALLGDAFSSRQSYKDLVPWNTSVKAHVSLTIKNRDGKRYTIEKSFPKGEASLTYLGKADTEDSSPRTAQRIAEGKQVNTVILQKLGLEHDSSSLIKLLWIKQGEALSLFSNMGTRKGQGLVEEPLIRRIREAIREQLSSPIADELIKRLQEDRDSYIKADGKYKSARNSMGKEILDLKSELNETKQSIRSCENEMEEFRDKIGILQNITAEIDRAQEQLQKKQQYISQLKKKREACDSLKEITLTLDPLLEKEKHLHELMRQKKETAELLPAAYAKMKRLAGEELAAIEEMLAKDKKTGERLEKKREELNSIPEIDKKTLETAEELEYKIRRIEDKLHQTEVNVRVTPEHRTEVKVAVDTEQEENLIIDTEKRLTAARTLRFTYPGHFTMDITGPLSQRDFEEMEKANSDNRQRLSKLLQPFGASDSKNLREYYERRRELYSETETLKKELGGTDRDRLQEQKKRLEAELSTPMDLFSMQPSAELPGQIEEKKSVSEIRHAIDLLEQTATNIEKNIDTILQGRTAEAFIGTVEEMKEKHRKQEEVVRGLPPEEISEITAETIGRKEQEISGMYENISGQKEKKARLETEIENQDDLKERYNNLVFTKDRITRHLKEKLINLSAIQTLLTTLTKAKERREQNIVLPVQESLTRAFQRITDGRYSEVELDKEFGDISIKAKTYDESPFSVAPQTLSTGTQEQLSFLFRLSLARHLSGAEPQIMILDESFVNTDAERKKELLSLIREAGEDIQFLIFTCNESDYRLFEPYGSAIDLKEIVSTA